MKKLLILGLVGAMIAGCGIGNSIGTSANSSVGRSSGNGSSFFGRRQADVPQTVEQARAQEFGDLVPVVRAVNVEPTAAGAIVHVVGEASRLGYFDIRLVAPNGTEPNADGVIILELRAQQPPNWTAASTPRAREIHAGRFISAQKLSRANAILVVAAQNQITARR